MADKPRVDVGGIGNDPATELHSNNAYVRGIRLENGDIAVPDVSRIQIFDRNGKRRRILGREGSGPGEFRSVINICAVGKDTLLILDGPPNNRVTVAIGSDLRQAFSAGVNRLSSRPACLRDGSMLVFQRIAAADGGTTLRIHRVAIDGILKNEIAQVQLLPYDPMVPRPFPPAVSIGNKIYVGDATSSDVKVYDPEGHLRMVIRTDDAPVPVNSKSLPAITTTGGASRSGSFIRRPPRTPLPSSKFLPGFGDMQVDPMGRLWLKDWAAVPNYEKPERWTAFDSTGRMIGKLNVPPGGADRPALTVGFGKNELFVWTTDDNGAPHLLVYDLIAIH